MHTPISNQSLATQRRLAHLRLILVSCISILLAISATMVSVRLISQRTLLKQLPALPNLSGHHQSLVEEIQRLDAEVRANPRSVDKVALLGLTYHANEKFEEARACYQLIASLCPRDYRWPYYLAVVEEALGSEDQAIRLLGRVTQLEPRYVHTWARLGNLLRRSSRLGEAKAAFSMARSLDPIHPHACLGLARIAAKEDDWEAVIQILEPMLRAHPLFAPALRLLSRAYVQIGRKPPFEENLDTRIPIEDVIDEPLLNAVYERSVLAFIQGNPDRGKALLQVRCIRCHTIARIEQTDKNPREWLHTLGRMQRQAGREWLGDSDTAHILSYLVNRRH